MGKYSAKLLTYQASIYTVLSLNILDEAHLANTSDGIRLMARLSLATSSFFALIMNGWSDLRNRVGPWQHHLQKLAIPSMAGFCLNL